MNVVDISFMFLVMILWIWFNFFCGVSFFIILFLFYKLRVNLEV